MVEWEWQEKKKNTSLGFCCEAPLKKLLQFQLCSNKIYFHIGSFLHCMQDIPEQKKQECYRGGSFMGVCVWPVQQYKACAQKGPMLGLMLSCYYLEILNNLCTKSPTFSFCTGFCKLCCCKYSNSCYRAFHVCLSSQKDNFYTKSGKIINISIFYFQFLWSVLYKLSK